MRQLDDQETGAEQILRGLRKGRWSPDTAVQAALYLLDVADNAEELNTSLDLYATAAHAKNRGAPTEILSVTRTTDSDSDALGHDWRVQVHEVPEDEIERWRTILDEVAPNSEIVYSDRPLLDGDVDSFSRLSRALHLALDHSTQLPEESHEYVTSFLQEVDGWLSKVPEQ